MRNQKTSCNDSNSIYDVIIIYAPTDNFRNNLVLVSLKIDPLQGEEGRTSIEISQSSLTAEVYSWTIT